MFEYHNLSQFVFWCQYYLFKVIYNVNINFFRATQDDNVIKRAQLSRKLIVWKPVLRTTQWKTNWRDHVHMARQTGFPNWPFGKRSFPAGISTLTQRWTMSDLNVEMTLNFDWIWKLNGRRNPDVVSTLKFRRCFNIEILTLFQCWWSTLFQR